MYFLPIAFASPEFDEYVKIRYTEILEPMGLDFDESLMDAEKDLLHFGLFNPDFQLLGAVQLDLSNATVSQLAISKAYQNRGFGTMLIENIKQVAIEKKLSSIEIAVSQQLSAFFTKFGFLKIENHSGSEFESPLVQMKLKLA
jgi:N-acetylglutamate synthase-like GNAT family acetyltransferase